MRTAEALTLGDAAISYAYRDWPVFPLHGCTRGRCSCGNRECSAAGKHPRLRGVYREYASTDEAQVREWWTRWPNANIGHPTGNLVVVEIDGPAGLATMQRLRERHEWPETLTAMSGRAAGGLHFYFRAPEDEPIYGIAGRRGGRGIGKGIDVRGVGHLVVLPPSIHESGRRYTWLRRIDAAPLPAWMVARLRKPEPKPLKVPRRDPEGWASGAFREAVDAVLLAAEGTLNDELNRQAFRLGRLVGAGALSESHVREALLSAAVRAGHPERGAARTIESGLSAGMKAR